MHGETVKFTQKLLLS